jgi:hypothetical protein
LVRDDCKGHRGHHYRPFIAGLPFGVRLVYDGHGLWLEKARPPEDGDYGVVRVRGGQIAEVAPAPIPAYTPPPCQALPSPCDEEDGGYPGLSPDQANLTTADLAGRLLTKLYAQAGANVTVTGSGTQADPFIFSAAQQAVDFRIISDSPGILPLTGDGTQASPKAIRHEASVLSAGKHGSYTIDSYGHVTGYETDSTSTGTLTLQVAPSTLTMETQDGATLLGLPAQFDENVTLYTDTNRLTFDMFGRLIQVGYVDNPSFGRFSAIFTGRRTSFTLNYTSGFSGKVRISYKGDIGVTENRYGFSALPSGNSVTFDGHSVDAYCGWDGTRATGIEVLTATAAAAGTHAIVVTLAKEITEPGIMDVSLCHV